MKKNSFWMAVSGTTGLLFFVIANFTHLVGADVLAGCLQLAVNTFVFITWLGGFRTSTGLNKFIAFWGVAVPVIMASITIVRVLIPAIFS
jgi:hypothetical protein